MTLANYPRPSPLAGLMPWNANRQRAMDYLSLAKLQRTLSNKYLAWAAEDLASATMQQRGMGFFNQAKKLRQRARDNLEMARSAKVFL